LLAGLTLLSSSIAWGQMPPTKVFAERDIPLSEIFSEWEGKGLNGDMFICSCDRMSCDTNPYWPFRVFRAGQSIPVLGDFNRNIARSNGFICAIRPR
jgi:hypothetical protein|tara:strand:- start:118 stop:408 length:291 start_codon:yes stop_codon:yes gene_type:complete